MHTPEPYAPHATHFVRETRDKYAERTTSVKTKGVGKALVTKANSPGHEHKKVGTVLSETRSLLKQECSSAGVRFSHVNVYLFVVLRQPFCASVCPPNAHARARVRVFSLCFVQYKIIQLSHALN